MVMSLFEKIHHHNLTVSVKMMLGKLKPKNTSDQNANKGSDGLYY